MNKAAASIPTEVAGWSRNQWLMFVGVGLLSAILLTLNLSYPLPWNDEATMMFLGKQLLETGHASVWDGRNMMGYRNGHYITDDLSFFYPPVPYTLAAIAMAIFGVHDWSYRLLNCLLALVTLAVFAAVLRRELPKRPYVSLIAFALVALQPAFLLFMRQANYYSIFMLANLCFYFSLRSWMQQSRGGHAWLAGSVLAGVISFITLYFGALWVLACGLIVLAENWRNLNKRRWAILVGAGALWLAICCYNFFASGVAGFADKYTAFLYNYSWVPRKLLLMLHSLGASSELDTLPWPLGVLALAVAGRQIWVMYQNKSKTDRGPWPALVRHLALCLSFMVILVLVSFESPIAAAGIDIRYRHFLMPFFAIPGALMIDFIFNFCRANKKQIPKWVYEIIPYPSLNKLSKVLAVLITFFTITTDYVSQPVSRHDFYDRPLPDLYLYVRELVTPQADVVRAVAEAIDELPLKEGDTLAIHTGGKLEYPPVVWQLSDKILICCQIDRYSRNFRTLAKVSDLAHFLRLDPEVNPRGPTFVSGRPIYPKGKNLYKASYIVIYRKYIPEVIDMGYRIIKTFPFVYHFAYSRPELRYHIYDSDFFFAHQPSGEQLILLQAFGKAKTK
ncbi:MAG: glycosyltransferase family 39 protein [Betaproteobacteria bacterium]|nr:glycosyltransferase family 39 protein [Betaproteobacteria bacterium]